MTTLGEPETEKAPSSGVRWAEIAPEATDLLQRSFNKSVFPEIGPDEFVVTNRALVYSSESGEHGLVKKHFERITKAVNKYKEQKGDPGFAVIMADVMTPKGERSWIYFASEVGDDKGTKALDVRDKIIESLNEELQTENIPTIPVRSLK